jgi:hypothetical protein
MHRRNEMRNGCEIFVGKPEGKKTVGRLRRRWQEHIKMDVWEIGWESVRQGPVAGCCEHGNAKGG